MTIQENITQKLTDAFTPEHLEVINESHMHNVPEGSESHFKVLIVCDDFQDKMLIARHRMVNKVLDMELKKDRSDGGILTLTFMKIGCSMFNKIVTFNIRDELGKGNIAVGLMVMGLFIGIGIALGLVIGLGLS